MQGIIRLINFQKGRGLVLRKIYYKSDVKNSYIVQTSGVYKHKGNRLRKYYVLIQVSFCANSHEKYQFYSCEDRVLRSHHIITSHCFPEVRKTRVHNHSKKCDKFHIQPLEENYLAVVFNGSGTDKYEKIISFV